MTAGGVTVLYVAGAGRSGTTLLDRMLGTLGATSGAELNRVWLHGVLLDRGCTCGSPFSECAFWQAVVERAMGDDPEQTARRAVALQSSVARSRDFGRLYTSGAGRSFRSGLAEYRELVQRLYLAVADVSGNRVIIDSSKIPSEALVLSGIPDVDVRVVHLVRDPRACVYSWRRHRIDPGHGGTQGVQSTLRTIGFWNTRNLLSGRLARRLPYVRLSYEDLTADPVSSLRRVCDAVGGVDEERLRLHGSHAIELPVTHSVSGNPSRYRTGLVELHTDDEWRERIKPSIARLTTMLTLPLLTRYGYPLNWRHTVNRPMADVSAA